MVYTDQMEAIWIKISAESLINNRPATSRDSFRRVCEAFVQAEERPPSDGLSREIKSFIAERKIWAYYFGDDVPFPGVDPAVLTTQSPLMHQEHVVPTAQETRAAAAMTGKLLAEWRLKPYRRGYRPQFGWNPMTGEPWFALRCYAEMAYPALSGPDRRYMLELSEMEEDFILHFEKFASDGYTLVWPEFKHGLDLRDINLWKKFNRFRGFLTEWVEEAGHWRAPISKSYRKFLSRAGPADELPLPMGFEHCPAAPLRDSPQLQPQTQPQLQPQPLPPRVEMTMTLAYRPRDRERSRSPLTRLSRLSTSPRRGDYRRGENDFHLSGLGRSRGGMAAPDQNIINQSSYGSRRRGRSRSPLMRNVKKSPSLPSGEYRRRPLEFGSGAGSSRAVKEESRERYLGREYDSSRRSPRIKDEFKEENDINDFDDRKPWTPPRRNDRHDNYYRHDKYY